MTQTSRLKKAGGTFVLLALVGGCSSGGSGGGNQFLSYPGDGGSPSVLSVTRTDLVSDQAGAAHQDAQLVNAWGLAASANGFWWVADNGTGLLTAYDAAGVAQNVVVTVPAPAGAQAGTTSAPTGLVFNPTTNFAGDLFVTSTEDGRIAGWATGTTTTDRVDNSGAGAVYKGLAISPTTLFAANFHAGNVEKYDVIYAPQGSFTDDTLPAGYAPFNVAVLNGEVYVSFALQDADKKDEVAGPGNGFVDVFDLNGDNRRRLVSNGPLDAPWGMVIAPTDFGAASNMLLVGNFGGDHWINVFDPTTGAHLGHLGDGGGNPLAIDGLWALQFGNDGLAGAHNELFFTSGPNEEAHGLFGKLVLVP